MKNSVERGLPLPNIWPIHLSEVILMVNITNWLLSRCSNPTCTVWTRAIHHVYMDGDNLTTDLILTENIVVHVISVIMNGDCMM